MNLTLFFIVLSAIIGYFLYDTFKKSRPQTSQQSGSNPASKIKRNYTKQCTILKGLHEQKANNLKYRTISIHFNGSKASLTKEAEKQEIELVGTVLNKIQEKAYVYLVRNSESPITQIEAAILESIPKENHITYNSLDGGVAVLRQLGCGLHIEGDFKMLLTIKQYIKKIWTFQREAEFGRYFPNEIAILVALDELRNEQNDQLI